MTDRAMRHMLVGLARLIATQRPPFAYREDSAYLPADWPVTIGALHKTAEATAALTAYDDQAVAVQTRTTFVQLRLRHPRYLDGLDVVSDLSALLHDHRYLRLGDITVSHITQRSLADMGRDANGRHEWGLNFLLLANRAQPTTQGVTP